uniref:Uncharacterized protein n=1 Tax=Arundo donax TaxID=35708 RepID=A0A0A9FPB0_ARUDO
MENTRRSNRSSASPTRHSPSPRSCSSTVLTRTRSSNSSSQCCAAHHLLCNHQHHHEGFLLLQVLTH